MSGLNGARIALLESRMSSELAGLVQRHGGEPRCVPSVREQTVDAAPGVRELLDALAAGEVDVVVFLTGVGASRLLAAADALGRRSEMLAALGRATNVCRGPKPVAVLRRNDVPVSLTAPEPHTSADLIAALDGLDVRGRGVALLHYGERNAPLAEALRARGARLRELHLYEWQLPEDTSPLRNLVGEVVDGHVDAVAFTSQVQIRHLYQMAVELGRTAELIEALNGRVVTAAVGPTCAAVLRELGVTPRIVPEHPKMGHLVAALARHFGAEACRHSERKEAPSPSRRGLG